MTLDNLEQEWLTTQEIDRAGPLRRRAFRYVIRGLPSYLADKSRMDEKRARRRLRAAATANCLAECHRRNETEQTYGIIGITLIMLIGAVVVAAVEWVVERILNHIWPESEVQRLALEAEKPGEDE